MEKKSNKDQDDEPFNRHERREIPDSNILRFHTKPENVSTEDPNETIEQEETENGDSSFLGFIQNGNDVSMPMNNGITGEALLDKNNRLFNELKKSTFKKKKYNEICQRYNQVYRKKGIKSV